MRGNELLHIVHTESSTGWGGQEIRVLTESQGMLSRGHRVTLLCPPEAEIHPAALKLGIPTIALPIARKRPAGLAALRTWLRGNDADCDVINTHSSTDSWLVALTCASLRNGPAIIRTRHVSTPVRRSRANRWLYQRAVSHLVTTGEALRAQLHRDNGFALERMTSVPTGIDLARFQPRPRAPARAELGLAERPALGILATLRDWKGHDYLLEAMSRLRTALPDWHLLVIGDGPRREHLEAAVAAHKLSAAVTFVGNRDDAETWLNALDLFVLPSYGDEGVPQAIMQAMARALPVVSTSVGAISEAVIHRETGLIVPPRDSAALAEALARLMRDPDLRADMGRKGRVRAERHFGIERMLDSMENIFRRYARREKAAA